MLTQNGSWLTCCVILMIFQARYWADKAFDEQQNSTGYSQDNKVRATPSSVVLGSGTAAGLTASASGTLPQPIDLSTLDGADPPLSSKPQGPSTALKRHENPIRFLSEQEKEDFKEVFAFFDMNKFGTIGISVINTIMQTLGQNLTDAEINSLMVQAGVDKKLSLKIEGKHHS